MFILPTDQFQWQSWDCFALANWVRVEHGLPAINAQWVYELHPTQDSFQKDSLLLIVPMIGTRQQSIAHLNILLIRSECGNYCLGTAIAHENGLWCVLMGETHAHCIPLDRLPMASVSGWLPRWGFKVKCLTLAAMDALSIGCGIIMPFLTGSS